MKEAFKTVSYTHLDVYKRQGVMGIMKKAGQYQIIIGNDVANVYAELNKLGNFSNEVPKKAPQNKEKQNVFSMLMDTISGIMAPVIPVSYTHLDVYKRQKVVWGIGYKMEKYGKSN